MRRTRDNWLSLGPLLMAAGVALWLWPAPPLGDAQAVEAAAREDLRRAVPALKARCAQLAQAPRTRTIVATDAETAADMSDEELGIHAQSGEQIALSQRLDRGPSSLLVSLPRNVHASVPLAPEGLQLMASGTGARMCGVAPVVPVQPRPGLTAHVSVCAPLQLRALQAYLHAHEAAASLVLGQDRITLASSAAILLAPQPLTIRTPELSITLELQRARARRSQLLLTSAAALALLGALLSMWPSLGRKQRASRTPKATRPLAESAHEPQASAPAPLPTRLGRYELQRRIGAGGMGEVHLARMHGEAGFERTVALKIVTETSGEQALLQAHFLDEARLAARIHHPNVVDVLALEKLEGRYVIAMEYVDGADLARLLGAARKAAEPVPVPVALRIAIQVCAGVQAAHRACAADGSSLELIHRDIKSANILISRAGAVKVGDFGVARAAQQHMLRATHNDTVKGTIGYMPPEQQLRGELDARSDQYAIGAVLYELLSGRPVDLDVRRLLPLGTSDWPHLTPLDRLRADLPHGLASIVTRALAYHKQDRFADCAALQDALEHVCEQVAGVTDRAVAHWATQLMAAGKTTRVSD